MDSRLALVVISQTSVQYTGLAGTLRPKVEYGSYVVDNVGRPWRNAVVSSSFFPEHT